MGETDAIRVSRVTVASGRKRRVCLCVSIVRARYTLIQLDSINAIAPLHRSLSTSDHSVQKFDRDVCIQHVNTLHIPNKSVDPHIGAESSQWQKTAENRVYGNKAHSYEWTREQFSWYNTHFVFQYCSDITLSESVEIVMRDNIRLGIRIRSFAYTDIRRSQELEGVTSMITADSLMIRVHLLWPKHSKRYYPNRPVITSLSLSACGTRSECSLSARTNQPTNGFTLNSRNPRSTLYDVTRSVIDSLFLGTFNSFLLLSPSLSLSLSLRLSMSPAIISPWTI